MIPPKLLDAFEKIRLGKVDEGMKMFDRIKGGETAKTFALAELAYFRHDWKWAMTFTKDCLLSDEDIDTWRYAYRRILLSMDSEKKRLLTLLVLAAWKLDCWKESIEFIKQLQEKERNDISDKHLNQSNRCKHNRHDGTYQTILSMLIDKEDTIRHLILSKPKIKTDGDGNMERTAAVRLEGKKWHANRKSPSIRRQDARGLSADIRTRESSAEHIRFYEMYWERLEDAVDHSEAAKSCIALDDLPKAKDCLKHYVECWTYAEPYQVAPIELFTDTELWAVMSDKQFTESLLKIPHNHGI